MSSVSKTTLISALVGGLVFVRAAAIPPLRVCADPNNLPYSDRAGAGFENAIARLIASDLHRPLGYLWQPQRRGFLRTTLKAQRCDVVVGLVAGTPGVALTRPYYRSAYMFVRRHSTDAPIASITDPRLAHAKIGVQITGLDYDNPPPVQALAMRGLAANVRGFPVYGDASRPSPLRSIVDAVAAGDVDIAAVWGPVAGFFAATEPLPLDLTRITMPVPQPSLPLAFDIAIGVRVEDGGLRAAIDGVLARRHHEIDAILDRFHVPRAAADD